MSGQYPDVVITGVAATTALTTDAVSTWAALVEGRSGIRQLSAPNLEGLDLPSRAWLSGLFAKRRISDIDRAALLNGGPTSAGDDPGPVVCSCFGVGRNTICKAIAADRLKTAQDVGSKVRAGTNCGSCLPEIRSLLANVG